MRVLYNSIMYQYSEFSNDGLKFWKHWSYWKAGKTNSNCYPCFLHEASFATMQQVDHNIDLQSSSPLTTLMFLCSPYRFEATVPVFLALSVLIPLSPCVKNSGCFELKFRYHCGISWYCGYHNGLFCRLPLVNRNPGWWISVNAA